MFTMIRITVVICFFISSFQLKANVLGDMQTFAPNTDGLDFISVHTSRPLKKGFFAFGGHFSYAKDHLLVYKDFNTQEKYDYKDQLAEFDLTVAYALTDKFSAFFAAPTLLYHESEGGQAVDAQISTGVHTYRPGFKWTFTETLAFIGSIDVLNVTNSPYTGVDEFPIYNLEFAKTFRARDKVAYGLNLGYRIRTPTAQPVDANMFPLDDQYTFSVARSAPFLEKSRWVLEGIFSFPADKAPYKDAIDASSADILLGFKHRLMRNLNMDWGVTVEPFVETLAPRYRAFVGLVYYWNPGWTKDSDPQTPPPVNPEQDDVREDRATREESGDAFPPFEVTPAFSEVFQGVIVRIKATGGAEPYSYRVRKGGGRLNSESAYYRTPFFPEKAVIEVRDARDQLRIVQVVVKTPPKASETIRLKNLNFVFDTDILIESSQAEIRRIVGIFQKKKVSRIIVEGHTDSKGDDEYNIILSEKRAAAVAKILIQNLELREDQVTAIGMGESQPVSTNKTAKGRLNNRRVDLKVYYVR